ncbi:MAG: 50S ribosomal protein L29 [Acidobacteria bacterium]|nr:50S ribosomal protein L29 [Acidobacteriota bacterium]
MMKLEDLKDTKKIREFTLDQLKHEEKELKDQLLKLRFQLVAGQITNHNIIKAYRKGLARVKTIIVEKEKSGAQNGK